MSDIKNVPGIPVGPGAIDPTTQQEPTQTTERGSRFREIARRLKQKELVEQTTQANTPSVQSAPDISKAEALARKAQLQGVQPTVAKLGTSTTVSSPAAASTPSTANPTAASTLPATPFGQPTQTAATTVSGVNSSSGSGINLQQAFGQGQWTRNAPAPTTPVGADGNPIFVPTFETNVSSVNIAAGVSSPLNPVRFATQDTANWLVNQKLPALGFSGATVIQKNSLSTGAGPFGATQKELWIQLPDGTQFNAGVLADYYIRNPEDKFPGLADKYAKDMVNSEIQGKNIS